MSRKLSENDLNVENEVHIRPGGKEDLDFLVRTEDKSDPGYHMLLQATRWWDHLGFRCLYVGYLENQSAPYMFPAIGSQLLESISRFSGQEFLYTRK